MDQNRENQEISFAVGDQVEISEMKFSGAEQRSRATIVELRYILGNQTYVVETVDGRRQIVNASLLRQPTQ